MFNLNTHVECPAAWAYHLRQQKLALARQIQIFDITVGVVGDNASYFMRNSVPVCTVEAALGALPFRRLSAEVVDFLSSRFMVHYLIPVADPQATGVTWPTIVIPSADDLEYFCDTEEDDECVLEILRELRAHVDEFASAIPCSPLGWIGGIWVPHPDTESDDDALMCMRWPWLHPPYGVEGRPGDSRLFDLFNLSVDRR
jgi:hypothetical protein